MPLILPGNVASAAPTAYSIANSCRFNSLDSAYLVRTLGTPTNNDRWTFSCWVKRGLMGANAYLLTGASNGTNYTEIHFQNTDTFRFGDYQGSITGELITSRLFRDPCAWYHLMIVYDSANGTAGDRIKMYVNGVEETAFATDTNPSSGQDSMINSAVSHTIGSNVAEGGSVEFDGYMAEVILLD